MGNIRILKLTQNLMNIDTSVLGILLMVSGGYCILQSVFTSATGAFNKFAFKFLPMIIGIITFAIGFLVKFIFVTP